MNHYTECFHVASDVNHKGLRPVVLLLGKSLKLIIKQF